MPKLRKRTKAQDAVLCCLQDNSARGKSLLSTVEIAEQTSLSVNGLVSTIDGLRSRGLVRIINTLSTYTGFANRHSVVELTKAGRQAVSLGAAAKEATT